jgi:hypothetical protein
MGFEGNWKLALCGPPVPALSFVGCMTNTVDTVDVWFFDEEKGTWGARGGPLSAHSH